MGWINAALGIGKGLYSAYKIWFLIIPLAALIGSGYLFYQNAQHNKERLRLAEFKLGQSYLAAQYNNDALKQCLDANTNNALDAAVQRGRAEVAEAQVKRLQSAADTDIEEINREANNFRSELGCPAITPEFDRWVRE